MILDQGNTLLVSGCTPEAGLFQSLRLGFCVELRPWVAGKMMMWKKEKSEGLVDSDLDMS